MRPGPKVTQVSILNDVLGPVMRGPSSSHTAGSFHIAKIVTGLLGAPPSVAEFTFDPLGSYAQVYRQQGVDLGFAVALQGWDLTDDRFFRSLDIAAAYPPEARVARWRRDVMLDRKRREVVLAEDYVLGEAREPVRLHFMTPLAPDVSRSGQVVLARSARVPVSAGGEAGHVLLYPSKRFAASIEELPVDDTRLRPVWGGRLYRIVLTARDRAMRGSHRLVVRSLP